MKPLRMRNTHKSKWRNIFIVYPNTPPLYYQLDDHGRLKIKLPRKPQRKIITSYMNLINKDKTPDTTDTTDTTEKIADTNYIDEISLIKTVPVTIGPIEKVPFPIESSAPIPNLNEQPLNSIRFNLQPVNSIESNDRISLNIDLKPVLTNSENESSFLTSKLFDFNEYKIDLSEKNKAIDTNSCDVNGFHADLSLL